MVVFYFEVVSGLPWLGGRASLLSGTWGGSDLGSLRLCCTWLSTLRVNEEVNFSLNFTLISGQILRCEGFALVFFAVDIRHEVILPKSLSNIFGSFTWLYVCSCSDIVQPTHKVSAAIYLVCVHARVCFVIQFSFIVALA